MSNSFYLIADGTLSFISYAHNMISSWSRNTSESFYILNILKWNAKYTKMERAAGYPFWYRTFSMVKIICGTS